MNYLLQKVDDRYDQIVAIGHYEWEGSYQTSGDEPFTMADFEKWRYDKNIGQWVEGVIDEETGEWRLSN